MVAKLSKSNSRKSNMVLLFSIMLCSTFVIFFMKGIDISHTNLNLCMTLLSICYGILVTKILGNEQQKDKMTSKAHGLLFVGMVGMFLFLIWSFARTWEDTTPYFTSMVGLFYDNLFWVLILLCLGGSIALFVKGEKIADSSMLFLHLFGMMVTFIMCQHQLSQISVGTANLQSIMISQIVDFIPYMATLLFILLYRMGQNQNKR